MSFGRKKFNNKPKQDNPKRKQIAKPVQDDIKFDSNLELYMYNLLKENEVPFELKKEYVLQPAFNYAGETVRAITLTVDFYLPQHNIILDPKGFIQGATDVKWKLLKYHLHQLGEDPRICFVYSQKAARLFMESLHNGFREDIDDKFINGRVKRLKKTFNFVNGTFVRMNGDIACKVTDLSRMPNYDLYQLLKNA